MGNNLATDANADHLPHLWFVLPTCTNHHQATTTFNHATDDRSSSSSPCLTSGVSLLASFLAASSRSRLSSSCTVPIRTTA